MNNEKKRILIVDDNQAIHEDLKHILCPVDTDLKDSETIALESELFTDEAAPDMVMEELSVCYEMDDAYQGEEALKMVEEAEKQGNPYSLIFMDVRMPPGIDGVQTITKIWDKYPSIEIVICTAYSDYSWDKLIKTLGSTEHLFFLKKPFDSTTVKQTAFSLTNKWDMYRKNKIYVGELEAEVINRTNQMKKMKAHLEDLKKKTEQLSIAKKSFLSTLNLEIQTPLSGIMGVTDLLLDTDLNNEQRDFAHTIKSSGDSLLTTINDFLDFSELETETIELEEIEFNLRTTVENVADLISVVAYDKGLELATLIYSDVPETIVGDPLRLRQILLNFASTAVQKTKSGEIVISVIRKSIEKESTKKDGTEHVRTDNYDKLYFEVAITGEDISTELMTTWELSNDEDDPFSNSGPDSNYSGFSVCQKLVALMEGKMGVDVKEGKGPVLWFDAEFEVVQSPDFQYSNFTQSLFGLRCLILCDNPTSSKIITLHINHWGGKCREATTTESALEKLYTALHTRPFDIVIVDFRDGDVEMYKKFAALVKSHEPISKIPLICLTSKARRGDANTMKENGYRAYLCKPIRQSHLYNCLLMVKDISRSQLTIEQSDIITKHFVDEFSPHRYRVLVVEDSIINQRLLVRLLNKLTIRSDVANNGKIAVEAFNKKKYDMILMDCYMPIMDGYKATELIRNIEKETGRRIPILAITADTITKNKEKCLAVGMDDFINKPFVISEIATTLRNYC